MQTCTLLGNATFRAQLAIQSNATTGDQLEALIRAAGYLGPITALRILAKTADGNDRGAVALASPRGAAPIALTDFSTHGEYVAAGIEAPVFSEKLAQSYIRSFAGVMVINVAVES